MNKDDLSKILLILFNIAIIKKGVLNHFPHLEFLSGTAEIENLQSL